ncbi:MAG: hypothetical protein WDN26_04015 [Chitinophagaceae bacterium]
MAGVLNEELIFRGYCFKKTIEIAGLIKATIIFRHFIYYLALGGHESMG